MIIARRKDMLPGNALPHFLGVGVCVGVSVCVWMSVPQLLLWSHAWEIEVNGHTYAYTHTPTEALMN